MIRNKAFFMKWLSTFVALLFGILVALRAPALFIASANVVSNTIKSDAGHSRSSITSMTVQASIVLFHKAH